MEIVVTMTIRSDRPLSREELRRAKSGRVEFSTLPRRPTTVVLDRVGQHCNIGTIFRLCGVRHGYLRHLAAVIEPQPECPPPRHAQTPAIARPTAITNAPAIIRCSCSTSLAIWGAGVRPGNVHRADEWEGVLRSWRAIKARPHEYLEAEGIKYAFRPSTRDREPARPEKDALCRQDLNSVSASIWRDRRDAPGPSAS